MPELKLTERQFLDGLDDHLDYLQANWDTAIIVERDGVPIVAVLSPRLYNIVKAGSRHAKAMKCRATQDNRPC